MHRFSDDVTVTVKIPRRHAERLANWASLMRTISCSTGLLNEWEEGLQLSAVDRDGLTNNLAEWRDIGPAIDDLFMTVRSSLWQLSDKPPVQKKIECVDYDHKIKLIPDDGQIYTICTGAPGREPKVVGYDFGTNVCIKNIAGEQKLLQWGTVVEEFR